MRGEFCGRVSDNVAWMLPRQWDLKNLLQADVVVIEYQQHSASHHLLMYKEFWASWHLWKKQELDDWCWLNRSAAYEKRQRLRKKSIKPLLNHLYYAGPPINNRCYSKRSSFVLLQYWGGQTFTSNRKCPAARTSNSNIVSFLFSLDCKSLDCFILSFGEIPDISRYHNWLI